MNPLWTPTIGQNSYTARAKVNSATIVKSFCAAGRKVLETVLQVTEAVMVASQYATPRLVTAGGVAMVDSPLPGPADLFAAGYALFVICGAIIVGIDAYQNGEMGSSRITLEEPEPFKSPTLPPPEAVVPTLPPIFTPEKDKDSNITSFPLPSDTTPPIIVDPLPEQEEGDNIITAEDGEEDVKPSLKPYGSNQRANEQAQKQGYDDAHDLKESYVGPKEVAHYDMKYDTKTGEIYLESKDGKIQIPTGLYNIP